MTSKEIYLMIRNFDLEVGECFLDYNENFVKNSNLVFYLLGLGLIDKEKVNELIKKEALTRFDLNEIFEECGIGELTRRKILADMAANFEALENKIFEAYEEYELDKNISQDAKKLISPEIKNLYKE